MIPKGCLAGPREDGHAEAFVLASLEEGELCEHALWPLCPMFGNVQSESFSPGGHDAAGPCVMQAFRTARSLRGTEMGALLLC